MLRSKFLRMRLITILLTILLLLSGCGVKQEPSVKNDTTRATEQKDVSLKPKNFKGMYTQEGNLGKLFECETGRHFIISPDGDNRIFETVFKTFDSSNPQRKIYLSAEGFSSVQQRQNRIDFDTMLVVTKLIGTDTTFNCEK